MVCVCGAVASDVHSLLRHEDALGLPAVSRVLNLFTAYLPRVLAGVLIVFMGL